MICIYFNYINFLLTETRFTVIKLHLCHTMITQFMISPLHIIGAIILDRQSGSDLEVFRTMIRKVYEKVYIFRYTVSSPALQVFLSSASLTQLMYMWKQVQKTELQSLRPKLCR
jgi:hypothetical protein